MVHTNCQCILIASRYHQYGESTLEKNNIMNNRLSGILNILFVW